MTDAPATPRALVMPAAALAVMLAYAPGLAAPFVPVKLAVLVIAGALGTGIWMRARADFPGARIDRGIATAGLAVLLTTVLSAVLAARHPPGAPYAASELVRWAAAAGVALGTAALGARERGRLTDVIQVGAALVSVVGLAQHFGVCPLPIPSISVPGSTFGNRNVAAEAIAMTLPLGLAALSRAQQAPVRHPWAVEFVFAQVMFLAVARTRGAWVGGAAGSAVFLTIRRPRWSRLALLWLAAAIVGIGLIARVPGRWTAHDAGDAKRFAPASQVIHEGISPSSPVARTRLGLWRRAWTMARQAPLVGVGPGNFAVLFPRYAEPGAAADGVLTPALAPRRVHDDLLERLTETGALGLAALLALYVALARAAVRRAREPGDARSEAAGFAGTVAAFVGCGVTGFPMAMPGTVFLFAVAAGGLAAPSEPAQLGERAGTSQRIGALAVGLVLTMAAILWSAREIGTSHFLGRAQRTLRDPTAAAHALADLDRASRLKPGDFDVALHASLAALLADQPARAAGAAERALEIEPDSPNAWEALARARLDSGDPAGAVQAASRALERLHDYPAAIETRARATRALQEDGR